MTNNERKAYINHTSTYSYHTSIVRVNLQKVNIERHLVCLLKNYCNRAPPATSILQRHSLAIRKGIQGNNTKINIVISELYEAMCLRRLDSWLRFVRNSWSALRKRRRGRLINPKLVEAGQEGAGHGKLGWPRKHTNP